MRSFTLKIMTPDGVKFSGECESLLVRTSEGDVELLAGHTDLIATVGVGRVRIRSDKGERFGAIQGGTLTVLSGVATLLPITFEFADEIDLARAERARERAEQALTASQSNASEDIARAKLMRALNRISVAQNR